MSGKRVRTGAKLSLLGVSVALLVAGCGTAAGNSSSSSSNSSNNSTTGATQSLAAQAKKEFPNGVTLLVGYSTGGGVDTSARVLQPYLQKVLGVSVVVQNMTGGGGLVASNYLYKQPATSADIMMAYAQTLSLEQRVKTVSYTATNFTPLNGVYGHAPNVLIVNSKSPYKTLSDLESANKTLTLALSGVGNTPWLASAYLAEINHVKVQLVPFSSGGAASTAVMGGSVDLTMTSLPAALKAVKAGKARAILQMGPSRNPALPNVPTIQQAGGTSAESFDAQIGLFGPPNMNTQDAATLEAAILKAEQDPGFISKAKAEGLTPIDENASQWKSTVDSFDSKIGSQLPMLKKFLNS